MALAGTDSSPPPPATPRSPEPYSGLAHRARCKRAPACSTTVASTRPGSATPRASSSASAMFNELIRRDPVVRRLHPSPSPCSRSPRRRPTATPRRRDAGRHRPGRRRRADRYPRPPWLTPDRCSSTASGSTPRTAPASTPSTRPPARCWPPSPPAGAEPTPTGPSQAARRAFDDGTWGIAVAERDRADLLFKIAELLRRDTATSWPSSRPTTRGKPYEDAVWDIEGSAFMFEYYAGWATKISGDIPPVGPDAHELGRQGTGRRLRPDRAVELPDADGSQKVAPALAAGCTVVLKPAEQTPLTALGLARAADEAGRARRSSSTSLTGFGPEAGRATADPSPRRQDQLHRVEGRSASTSCGPAPTS